MFAVVTDSSAYFTRKEAERVGVRVLPMLYSVGGQPFFEGYADENGRYVELLVRGKNPHTSQVPASSYMSAFNELLRHGGSVLCVTISSRLSGAYSGAMSAAREFPTGRIMVVDSLSTAGGLKFLVEKACELSRMGCTLTETADVLERMRDDIGIVLSVDDMEALRRSGRLGFVRQSVGTILNVRPILYCRNGTVVSGGVARGASAQIAELARSVPIEASRVEVHYIANRTEALALQRALAQRLEVEPSLGEIGPVLGIHLGLSAIGASWQC